MSDEQKMALMHKTHRVPAALLNLPLAAIFAAETPLTLAAFSLGRLGTGGLPEMISLVVPVRRLVEHVRALRR